MIGRSGPLANLSGYMKMWEKFIEQKWKDALNEAAAEPGGWEASGGRVERLPTENAMSLA